MVDNRTWFAGRHGATRENNPKHEIMRGQRAIPLDEQGKKEARAMAAFFKDKGIKHIYYSPIGRAKETAAILHSILHIPATEDADLMTWNPGILTGKPVKAVKNVVNWFESHPNATVPDGEKTGAFYTRAKRAWLKYKGMAAAGKGPFVVIAHTRPLLVLQGLQDGITKAGSLEKLWPNAPGPGSVLQLKGNGYKLVRGKKQTNIAAT